jgi:hypothetical protein
MTAMNNAQAKLPGFSARQQRLIEAGVFLLIVTIGIASRFWLFELPNFKPVAAVALFGGFFFRKSWPAIAALIVIMVLSDLQLGVYDWKLAICVYTSLGLACGLGVWIKRSVDKHAQRKLGWEQAGRFAIASLAMSTAFYLLTNGAFWWMGQLYAASWTGLVDCYVAGIPFYRATLFGDVFFTGLLVGGYALVETAALRVASRRGLLCPLA